MLDRSEATTSSPPPAEPDIPPNGGPSNRPNGAPADAANGTAGAAATNGTARPDPGTRAQPAPVAARPDPARRLIGVALAVGALAQAALYLLAGRNVVGPTLHPDGDGYLLVARVLAGGPDATLLETRTIGYPLLIAPVYWFTDDPFAVFRGAQLVNAGLVAATFLLSYLFGRRVLAMRPLFACAAAAAAAAIPAAHVFGLLVLTEAAFTPVVVGWLVLVHAWLVKSADGAGRRTALAIGAGACTGYLYLVHSRALVMVALYLPIVLVLVLLRWVRVRDAAASIGGLAAVTVAGLLVNGYVAAHAYPEPLGSILARPIEGLTTVPGLVRSISDGAGQLWYLMLSTWGLAAVGIAFALTMVHRAIARLPQPPRRDDVDVAEDRGIVRARLTIMVVVLLMTFAVAVTTAAALPDENRVGNHMYGRYISQFTTVWVMIGLAALLNAGWRRAATLLAQGTALILVACFMVLAYAGDEVGKEAYYAVDMPEISLLGGSMDSLHLARASVLALVLLGGFAIALALPRRRWLHLTAAGLVGVAVFNAAATGYLGREIAAVPSARQYGKPIQLVRDAGARPGDVVVTSTDVDWAVLIIQQREVYWDKVRRFDAREPNPPGLPPTARVYRFKDVPAEATLYIAPWGDWRGRDWDGTKWGWRMVTHDEGRRYAVWRRA